MHTFEVFFNNGTIIFINVNSSIKVTRKMLIKYFTSYQESFDKQSLKQFFEKSGFVFSYVDIEKISIIELIETHKLEVICI